MHLIQRHRQRGFTLIELVTVAAIIGIRAAIALPSYNRYVMRGRRADVQSFMQQIAAKQQLFLIDRRAYASSYTDAVTSGGLGLTAPTSVTSFYAVTMTADNNASPPTYTITAAPSGNQANDSCGTLTLNAQGTRTATGTGSCW